VATQTGGAVEAMRLAALPVDPVDGRTFMEQEQTYRIRVRGELGAEWSGWFAGMELQTEPGAVTLLVGRLPDQAALHGVLTAIRDLGLELVSVESFASPASPTHPHAAED
jgi:hypothetical protein